MEVRGRISGHCSIGHTAGISFGDLTRPNLSAGAQIPLSCNLPFDVRVQAANGGLANAQFPGGQGPYAGSVGYTLDLAIPVLKPAELLVSSSLQSRRLMGAGQSISSQGGVAFDGMRLSITLAPPDREAGLLAGNYSETIVITIAPT